MKYRSGGVWAVAGSAGITVLLFMSSVNAERITSPNYQITSTTNGTFGGTSISSSYKMTAVGGEAAVGSGASGSYLLDQRQSEIDPADQTMQLSVQPSGLVAFYPFDENGGTVAADASAYQNNGSFSPGVHWAAGKIGVSSLDTYSTDYLTVPDNANLPTGTQMTVSAWANQSVQHSNDSTIASQWNYPSSPGWAIQEGPNKNLRVFIGSSTSDAGDNFADTAANTWGTYNVWRNVTVVYDGSLSAANRLKIYVNNVQLATTITGTIPATLQNSTAPLSIGRFQGLNRIFDGTIDHVKIFNRALSTTEIAAEYTAQNAGIPTGVTLGMITGNGSVTVPTDVIVRTNVSAYGLLVQQDHNLQNGGATIPQMSGTIASPVAWNEGVTKGLGFSIIGAPQLSSKWAAGANYAGYPDLATTFYSGSAHAASVVDVINVRSRLGAVASQTQGAYSNTITYTGTSQP